MILRQLPTIKELQNIRKRVLARRNWAHHTSIIRLYIFHHYSLQARLVMHSLILSLTEVTPISEKGQCDLQLVSSTPSFLALQSPSSPDAAIVASSILASWESEMFWSSPQSKMNLFELHNFVSKGWLTANELFEKSKGKRNRILSPR